MSESFELVTWQDDLFLGIVLQLRSDGRFVQTSITEEERLAAIDYHALVASRMHLLAQKWNETFGGNVVAAAPIEEGKSWSFRNDDVIEGELVEERRAISAPRKAIEGRRH